MPARSWWIVSACIWLSVPSRSKSTRASNCPALSGSARGSSSRASRLVDGAGQILGYDAENRLTSVQTSAGTATFTYDGDGNRVKGTVGGVTTTYIGNYFEWTGSTSTMKKYYYAGSIRVAMRTGSGTGITGVNWLFGDHLGSQSVTADASGSKIAEVRYKAWGEDRYVWGTTPTSYRYTGQRSETSLSIYNYGARWYDSSLGRFLSADTVIPGSGDTQGWDRFAYSYNNPLIYTDPSGHEPVDHSCYNPGDPGCGSSSPYSDWYSGKYSGCTMCHYAHAQDKSILTNDELATADQNFREWAAIGYTPMVATTMAIGGAEALAPAVPVVKASSPAIGKAAVDQVLKIINDPSAQTEVNVYVNEAGSRANLFARLDILTQTAIHEVKNVANLSLSQNFMDQAYRYKMIADSAGLELHYWLMNDAPAKVQSWLQNIGAAVHIP
jgi:RHS repeat-associated protein